MTVADLAMGNFLNPAQAVLMVEDQVSPKASYDGYRTASTSLGLTTLATWLKLEANHDRHRIVTETTAPAH